MTSSQYGLEPGISHLLHENISQDLKLPQANEFLVLSTYSKEKISEVVRKSFFLYTARVLDLPMNVLKYTIKTKYE